MVCLKDRLLAIAKQEGTAIGAMIACGVDSSTYETVVEDLFTLLTTDETLRSAARTQLAESIATGLDLSDKLRTAMRKSPEDYQASMGTPEILAARQQDLQQLVRAKEELVEYRAQGR